MLKRIFKASQPQMQKLWKHLDPKGARQSMGWMNWVGFRVRLILGKWMFRDSPFTFRTKLASHPVLCRKNTSDLGVFCQIFLEREYSCLDDLKDVSLVIDCGANCGYSSIYFLSRFPKCRVIAIEPDAGNFQALRKNLSCYGPRAHPIEAGVWSQSGRLKFVGGMETGDEWSRKVTFCDAEEGGIEAIDIASITKGTMERIDILKVDIEGSEVNVFGANYEKWIDRVDNIVIELHDDNERSGECSRVFFAAIADRGFSVSTCGELTVCKRLPVRD